MRYAASASWGRGFFHRQGKESAVLSGTTGLNNEREESNEQKKYDQGEDHKGSSITEYRGKFIRK